MTCATATTIATAQTATATAAIYIYIYIYIERERERVVLRLRSQTPLSPQSRALRSTTATEEGRARRLSCSDHIRRVRLGGPTGRQWAPGGMGPAGSSRERPPAANKRLSSNRAQRRHAAVSSAVARHHRHRFEGWDQRDMAVCTYGPFWSSGALPYPLHHA